MVFAQLYNVDMLTIYMNFGRKREFTERDEHERFENTYGGGGGGDENEGLCFIISCLNPEFRKFLYTQFYGQKKNELI